MVQSVKRIGRNLYRVRGDLYTVQVVSPRNNDHVMFSPFAREWIDEAIRADIKAAVNKYKSEVKKNA